MNKNKTCPDCGVGIGKPHHEDCDVQRCSVCGQQRIICDCEGHDSSKAIWTGEWPATRTIKASDTDERTADVIITDDPTVGQGRKKLLSWPEFAAEVLPQLQRDFPEFKQVTLEQFIRHFPFRFEIVE